MKLANLTRKHWVARYAKGITVLGILVILGGVVWMGCTVYNHFYPPRSSTALPNEWLLGLALLVDSAVVCLMGFLVIALSELLMYTIGDRQKPGWFLRNGVRGLFLMAGLMIVGPVSHMLLFIPYFLERKAEGGMVDNAWFMIWGQFLAWPLLALISKVCICVTLGLTLRRVLPVIEESKAVV